MSLQDESPYDPSFETSSTSSGSGITRSARRPRARVARRYPPILVLALALLLLLTGSGVTVWTVAASVITPWFGPVVT